MIHAIKKEQALFSFLFFWLDEERVSDGADDTRACREAIKIRRAVDIISQAKGEPSGNVVTLEV